MNTEQKAKYFDSIIYSDCFDELVTYRLQMSLVSAMEDLGKWSKVKDLEADYRFQDYVDNIKYCRSLVNILEAFTIEDYTETRVQLNKYSLVLEEMF